MNQCQPGSDVLRQKRTVGFPDWPPNCISGGEGCFERSPPSVCKSNRNGCDRDQALADYQKALSDFYFREGTTLERNKIILKGN